MRPSWGVGSGLQERLPFLAIAATLAALGLLSVGLPATLLLVGGWLLATALSRVPGLEGPASWAAAIIVEVGLVSTASTAVAALSGHQHGRLTTLCVLALPAAAGAVGVVATRKRSTGTPSRWLLAATVTATGLALPLLLAARGPNVRVAWATSGDARNHVLIMRQVMGDGGLTLHELRNYPVLIDNLASLLSTAGGRTGMLPGRLMLHDIDAMAATYVVSGIAVALLIMSALLELVPAVTTLRRLPPSVVIVLLAAASLSTSALVLGTSVLDGYLTAYGSLPLVLATTVLALRCCAAPSPAAFTLLGPATVLVFLSWSLLAAVPAALILTCSASAVVRSRRGSTIRGTRASWTGAALVSYGALIGVVGVVLTHLDQLHQQVVQPGSVTRPQTSILLLLGLLAVVLMAVGPGRNLRWQLLVPFTASVAGGATVQLLIWLGPHDDWTYYSSKSLYLFSAGLVWLLVVPVLLAVAEPAESGVAHPLVLAAGGSAAALLLVSWSTTVAEPVTKSLHGWNQPSAKVLTEAATVADRGHPFVLWNWTNGADERLGNFWAALAWGYDEHVAPRIYGPSLTGGIAYWAYIEQGHVRDLCRAAKGVKGLYVVTHNPGLKLALQRQCPHLGEHVVVEPLS